MNRRYIIVTGASIGIGNAYARTLAARGDCSLILVGRDLTKLSRTAAEVEKIWKRDRVEAEVRLFVVDLAEPESRAAFCRHLNEAGLPLAGFYHCAGVSHRGPFLSRPYEAHRRLMEVNCLAAIQMVHYCLPELRNRRGGEIVLLSSRWAFFSAPFFSTYAASKSCLLRWAAGLAAELRGSGVRVLVQCPGHTLTESSARRPRVWGWMPVRTAEQVAVAGIRALAANRTVAFDGFFTRWLVAAARCLPSAWASAFLRKRLQPRKV